MMALSATTTNESGMPMRRYEKGAYHALSAELIYSNDEWLYYALAAAFLHDFSSNVVVVHLRVAKISDESAVP